MSEYWRGLMNWKEKHPHFDETVCLQRDSLDLYIDGTLVASAPISPKGMDELKASVTDQMRSGILYQIKIRDKVQWESMQTQIEE